MNSPSIAAGDLPFAHGGPLGTALMRATPEDFCVTERMNIARAGSGEHLWILIRKRNENTADVARYLAQLARVSVRDVGYAGLKDKHAVTTQWFSITLPGKASPSFEAVNNPNIEILAAERHTRKLQRGALAGNDFVITLRDITAAQEQINQRLDAIKCNGVPNYFGEQRFGHDGNNIAKAEALFAGKLREPNPTRRGLYISAARSLIFNQVLAARVSQACWASGLAGDVMQLNNASAVFRTQEIDAVLRARLEAGEIHPTAPLWGRGDSMAALDCARLEQEVVERYPSLSAGLEREELRQERRSTRLPVTELYWEWCGAGVLQLSFTLPAGSYATAVVREVVNSINTML